MTSPKMRESDFWERNLPINEITLDGLILALASFIGFQTYRMNGCIKRIEGTLKEHLRNGSN